MNRRRPKLTSNSKIPVIIFKGEHELKEFHSIQEAGKWLQQYTGHRFKRFKQVFEGIFFDKPWNYDGVTYYFTTAKEAVVRKKASKDKNLSI